MINNDSGGVRPVTRAPKFTTTSVGYEDYSNEDPLHITTKFVNTLSVPVTIVTRSGFRHTVLPALSFGVNKTLIIRTEIRVVSSMFKEVNNFLNSLDNNLIPNTELAQLRETFNLQVSRAQHHGAIILRCDTVIDTDCLIDNHDNSIYLIDKDIVISTKQILDAPEHPHSPRSVDSTIFNNNDVNSKISGFAVEIIDNDDNIGPRYYLAANEVIKVTPAKGVNKPNGVYVYLITTDDHNHKATIQKNCSLNEAQEKFGLYRTRQEALSAGDIKTVRQELMSTLEHQYKLQIQELSNAKLRVEQELLLQKSVTEQVDRQSKAELAMLQNNLAKEQLRAEEQRLKMKDSYEEKSITRKEHSDLIKYLPTIAIFIGSIIIAVAGKPKKE